MQTVGGISLYIGIIIALLMTSERNLSIINSNNNFLLWLIPVLIGAMIIRWLMNRRNF